MKSIEKLFIKKIKAINERFYGKLNDDKNKRKQIIFEQLTSIDPDKGWLLSRLVTNLISYYHTSKTLIQLNKIIKKNYLYSLLLLYTSGGQLL